MATLLAFAAAGAACFNFDALSGSEGDAGGADGGNDSAIISDGGLPDDAASFDGSCTPFSAPPDSACTTTGACVVSLVSAGQDAGYPIEMGVDDTNIFLVASDDTSASHTGTIQRIAKSGSGAREVIARGQNQPWGLTIDDGYVYWVNEGGADAGASSVWRLAKNAPACTSSCSPAENVFAGMVGHPIQFVHEVDNDEVFIVGSFFMNLKHSAGPGGWVQGPSFSALYNPDLFVDPAKAYFVQAETNEIDEVSRAGDSRFPFAYFPNDAGVRHVVSDCNDVYGLANVTLEIERFPKSAADKPVHVQTLPSNLNPYQFAIDDTFLYIGSADGPGVYRVRKDGTKPPQQILAGNVFGMTQDNTAVYWGDRTDGSIHKFVK